MKAAVLPAFGSELQVLDVPDPVGGAGVVVVDMVAAIILNYSGEIFRGERGYLMELPMVPGMGGVGKIRSLGADATRLKVGDWVYCDSTVRSRDDINSPDVILQGGTAGNAEGALRLQRYFHNGSYAEQMLTPTENVFALPHLQASDAARWCQLGRLLVPFGGLLSIGLRPGETILINGATGRFGSAAVQVALAMGAAKVVATGRNTAVLERLGQLFGARVRPVAVTGDEEADRRRITTAAGAPLDCMLDILPPQASPSQVEAAVHCVRPNGRISLMGGVGIVDGAKLSLPYRWIMRNNITIRGQWMYTREAVPRMISMVHAGLIELDMIEVTEFALADINLAVNHAGTSTDPFSTTIVIL